MSLCRSTIMILVAGALVASAHAQSLSPVGGQDGTPAGPVVRPAQAGGQQVPVNVYIMQGPTGHAATPMIRDEEGGLKPLPDIPRAAFEAAQSAAVPVSKPEADAFRRNLDDVKRATAEPLRALKPVIGSITMDLSPGAVPPVIRAARGHGTVVTFTDSTGAPWPVAGVDGFGKDIFEVAFITGDKRPSSFQIRPSATYGSGNVAVLLEGLPTAVLMSVEIGYADEVDYRFDVKVPGRGPAAVADPAPAPMPAQVPQYLIDILHGLPPKFARPVSIQGGTGQAWVVDSKLVLRTTMLLLSPIPNTRVPSQDGTFVYELDYVPVLLASADGREIQITVSE